MNASRVFLPYSFYWLFLFLPLECPEIQHVWYDGYFFLKIFVLNDGVWVPPETRGRLPMWQLRGGQGWCPNHVPTVWENRLIGIVWWGWSWRGTDYTEEKVMNVYGERGQPFLSVRSLSDRLAVLFQGIPSLLGFLSRTGQCSTYFSILIFSNVTVGTVVGALAIK